MIDITFDIQVDREGEHADPLLDDYELNMLLEHTRAQIARHVQNSLGDLRCTVHNQAPAVTITGSYSLDTEQLDINYHVDTCCKTFLMQAIMALNTR